jgi:hypothetical protein
MKFWWPSALNPMPSIVMGLPNQGTLTTVLIDNGADQFGNRVFIRVLNFNAKLDPDGNDRRALLAQGWVVIVGDYEDAGV